MGGEAAVMGNETVNGKIPRPLLRAALAATIAVLSMFVMGWGAIVWNGTRSAEIKNERQDARLETLEEGLKKIDGKLDRLLERRP